MQHIALTRIVVPLTGEIIAEPFDIVGAEKLALIENLSEDFPQMWEITERFVRETGQGATEEQLDRLAKEIAASIEAFIEENDVEVN